MAYQDDGIGIKGIAGIGGTILAASSLALYSFSPRVTERDAGLKLVRGELRDAQVEPGVKMDAILPHVSYIKLPKFLQRMQVQANAENKVAVRTIEKAQVFGDFEIHYVLDNRDPRFSEIYTKLKCDEIKDIEPFIKNYALPAIIDTYRGVKTAEVNNDLTAIGKKVAKALQATLDENGFTYIKISDVIASGVGLSPKANSDLEMIVSEERKKDLQKVQAEVAEAAVALTEKQAAVTTTALQSLRKAGVSEDQLVGAYYLQLLRDTDSIGKPLVPGPVPGTGTAGVVNNAK